METVLAGRYQIIQRLGGGGFGQTFLAHDRHLPGSPICVVKQFQPKATDPNTLEIAKRLFNREAETLYRLGHHDRIPRLLAHFEQENEFYLAQEYIEGHPLDQELTPGQQYDSAVVVPLLQDILEVLAFVHQQRVIHRDIKPANLMRRQHDGKIVLIDFGAVKEVSSQVVSAGEQNSSMTVAIGSPGYMPTEQQAFKPHYSSDIYAVGMIGIQALTGLSPRQLPRDHQTGEIQVGLAETQALIHPALVDLLNKMVRYDFRQRYQDAHEALKALQEVNQQLQATDSKSTVLMPGRSSAPTTPASLETQLPLQTQPSSTLSQVLEASDEAKEALRKLLAESLGPIGSLILQQEMAKAPDPQVLVQRLTEYLPDEKRAVFQARVNQVLQRLEAASTISQLSATSLKPEASSQPTTQAPTSTVDPGFIKRCEQELASVIGPIATVFVQRTVTQNPGLTQTQLVDELSQHLPGPDKAKAFQQSLLSS